MTQPPENSDTKPAYLPAILKFSDPAEFQTRHEAATRAGFELHKTRVEAFNRPNPVLDAWVITAPSDHQPWMGYVFRVNLNLPSDVDLPGISQSCKLRLVKDNETHSTWYPCRRGPEVVPLNQSWRRMTELLVYIDKDRDDFAEHLTPLLRGGSSSVRTLCSNTARNIKVQLHLTASRANMLAELVSLDRLMKGNACKAVKAAFSYLLHFGAPKEVFDLTSSFPHLADMEEIPDTRLRVELEGVMADLDEDQRLAYEGLHSLPDRLCFIAGGPGSGKTRWALTLALLTQSGARKCQVLYLLDINKPVDDAANRMYTMCYDLGINRSVVRVLAWPLVWKKGVNEKQEDVGDDGNGEEGEKTWRSFEDADFTEGFLRAMEPIMPRDLEKAPTLDEKAWDLFHDRPERYIKVDSALSRVLSADRTGQCFQADAEILRQSLIELYYEVLNQADFIATTPVAAPRLSGVFHPDLVIFDESAHAKELSTMISLAWFEPQAWVFTGDPRQTEPFVEGVGNRYSLQLRTSTMERADKNKAVNCQLLVNHRAYGGLERLASELFYDGAMRSNMAEDALSPPSVGHLRQWLKSLTVGKVCSGLFRVPRLIVSVGKGGTEAKAGGPSWNSIHHKYVMKQVDALLHDLAFFQVDSSEPGTIMILSPYKEAANRYQGAVNRLPTKQMRRRVQVRTVDTAQGQEADVVFLDMVRSRATLHTDNPKRLCVALTRARQAEVIMMKRKMATSKGYGMDDLPIYLRALWQKCRSGEQGAILHNGRALPKSWGREWAPAFGTSSVLEAGR